LTGAFELDERELTVLVLACRQPKSWRRGRSLRVGLGLRPKDGHQREDEVGLVQSDALRVDAYEDVGNLVFVQACFELERREGVLPQLVQA